MLRNLMKRVRNRKGFTLIELIVVVAILGILAAVAVPSYSGYQTTAKLNTNQSNLAVIQNAVYVYQAQNDKLPTAASDLESSKYLGKAAPVPIAVADAAAVNPYEAVTDDMFQMDSVGKVTIGQLTTGVVNLSGKAK